MPLKRKPLGGLTFMRNLALAMILAAAPLQAQSQARVIPEALRSLVSGPGGCSGEYTSRMVTIRYFPDVEFTRAECIAEHGDSASAVVGMDSSGILYLLESREAFNFLVDRHPPSGLDSQPSLEYAMTALELSGKAAFPIHLVKDTLQLAPAARKSIKVEPWHIKHGPHVWTIGFATITPAYEEPYAISWAVTIAFGKLVLVERNPD